MTKYAVAIMENTFSFFYNLIITATIEAAPYFHFFIHKAKLHLFIPPSILVHNIDTLGTMPDGNAPTPTPVPTRK